MNLSLVLPCYNESKQMLTTFERLADFTLANLPELVDRLQVVAVDDGSKDDTWEQLLTGKQIFLAKLATCSLPVKVNLISFSRNFGKEAAMLAGLNKVSADSEATIVLDADLQHPLSLIPKLIECFEASGADVVDAVKSDRGEESALNRFITNTFYNFFDKHSRIKLRDMADFKLISRRVREQLLALPEHERFFRGMTSWIGFKHAEVKFEVAERELGVSKWSFTSKVNLANDIFFGYSRLPELGQLLLTIVACALFGIQIIYWLIAGLGFGYHFDKVDYLLFVVLMMFVSVMLSKLWQTAYLARIYRANQKRPIYIVARED